MLPTKLLLFPESSSRGVTGQPVHRTSTHSTFSCGDFSRATGVLEVYSPRPSTLTQLKRNIRREVAALAPAMVLRALRDIHKRSWKDSLMMKGRKKFWNQWCMKEPGHQQEHTTILWSPTRLQLLRRLGGSGKTLSGTGWMMLASRSYNNCN